ncbi:MAG: caspase family protein [Acidobacteriota bacterium]
MKNKISIGFILAILTCSIWGFSQELNRQSVLREKRLALVIGNSSYLKSPLKNTVNDAVDISDALKSKGFEVILKTNADYRSMWNAIRDFGRKLNNSDIGLFYYSGHGVQVKGTNYLVPVRSGIISEDEIRFKAVDAALVLSKMENAGNSMNVVILDACRVNPYKRVRAAGTGGLARMDAPTGSLIVYSTSPGKTASDGIGRNGVFTKHLLRKMLGTDLEIGMLLRKVRESVITESRGKQVPWESSSLVGEFYFTRGYIGSKKPTGTDISPTEKVADFGKMNFFESGKDYGDISKRVYGNRFLQSKARYINTKINFKNRMFKIEDKYLNITLKFYRPDGSYWNSVERKIKVGKNLDLATYERLGWGWSEPGNWKPGKYKVKVFFNGKYVSQSEFSIVSSTSSASGSGYEFKKIQFFEFGEELSSDSKVTFKKKFKRSDARFIYSDIVFKNNFFNIKDQVIKMEIKYLKPDGSLWGTIKKSVSVSKDLDIATYDKGGWGWKTSGNWKPGRYSVEIYFNNKYMGRSFFEVY